MNNSNGLGFLAIVAAVLGVWFYTRKRAGGTPIIDTSVNAESGTSVVPGVPLSNSPEISGPRWETPYYLRVNYPTNRYAGMVAPYTASNGLPNVYGPQEIPPQVA